MTTMGDFVNMLRMAQKKDWESLDPWLHHELSEQLGITYLQIAVNWGGIVLMVKSPLVEFSVIYSQNDPIC